MSESELRRVQQARIVKSQIATTRAYTKSLLADLEPSDFFEMAGGPTHIAWQCGHIAMAQYALGLLRIRSKLPTDGDFITSRFFKFFKKTSVPKPDPADNPPLEEILQTMDAVYEQVQTEIDQYKEEQLAEELPEPFAVEATKLGSLYFCPMHELVHAGQIGLVRRLMGKEPVR